MIRSSLTLFTAAILAVACYFIGIAGLNYSGFCINEKRYLSDQEKILRVISIDPTYSEKFIKNNPNCCKVVDESPVNLVAYDEQYLPSIENRILGINKKLVYLRYSDPAESSKSQTQTMMQDHYIPITNCGAYNRLDSR